MLQLEIKTLSLVFMHQWDMKVAILAICYTLQEMTLVLVQLQLGLKVLQVVLVIRETTALLGLQHLM